jgi:hypothetical protein
MSAADLHDALLKVITITATAPSVTTVSNVVIRRDGQDRGRTVSCTGQLYAESRRV